MIIDVIISDLVPLKERGNYIAIVLTVYFVGLAIGMLASSKVLWIILTLEDRTISRRRYR